MPKSVIALLLLAALTPTLEAGVIRGLAVEKRTGYSLSRATVTLQPIPSNGQAIRAMRTAENGGFEFVGLPGGAYLLKATRRGFIPVEYGQRRWNSAGTVILLDGDGVVSVRLPMSRYGAVVGTVRDGNEVGIADQDVVAFRSTQPPQYVARAKSDDRGVFRIGGLEPGNYLVRTTGNTDDDRSYLATFARQTLRVEEASQLVVYPDEDTTDADIRPVAGRLFELSGSVSQLISQAGFIVTVTLASDMGRTVSNGPAFRFPSLPPGRYEIYAEARENPPGNRLFGGYTELPIERTLANFTLPMNEVQQTQFTLEGAGPAVSATGFVRRKDLAGVGAAEALKLGSLTRPQLFPGRWEFLVNPPDGYYVSRFSGTRNNTAGRPEGWNEILVNSYSRFAASLSSGGGGIHGVVKSSNAPAIGAPVFLETWDPVTRRRLVDLKEARADLRGNYRFDGLAPGDYRIVSTYEYAAPDSGFFDAASALQFRVEANGNQQQDLDLYGIP